MAINRRKIKDYSKEDKQLLEKLIKEHPEAAEWLHKFNLQYYSKEKRNSIERDVMSVGNNVEYCNQASTEITNYQSKRRKTVAKQLKTNTYTIDDYRPKDCSIEDVLNEMIDMHKEKGEKE